MKKPKITITFDENNLPHIVAKNISQQQAISADTLLCSATKANKFATVKRRKTNKVTKFLKCFYGAIIETRKEKKSSCKATQTC